MKVMFLAGEASGDALGAELLCGLQKACSSLNIPLEAFGAGGERLAKAGAEIAVDLTKHAVVGVWEVLKHYRTLRGLFMRLLQLAIDKKPDVVVLVDYPGFNLRFAKALKKALRGHSETDWSPKIVQFISPQIWAWHESRIHQIARDMEMILSIFPFEKAWYAAREPRLRVEYVGHPLMDRYKAYKERVRQHSQIEPIVPYHVLLLPGSREKELSRHLPILQEVVRLAGAQQKIHFKIVVPRESLVLHVRELFSTLSGNVQIDVQAGQLAEALLWADAAIASSGTVTMECAYFQVPTVILYRTSFLTAFLGRIFIKVKRIGMPNLLMNNKAVYPEFIQEEARADAIAAAMLRFLTDKKVRKETQEDLRTMLGTLGGEGACLRAAEKVLSLMR